MVTAAILAGGRGTRLASVVSDVPKPMALVNGHPFLHYQLLHLERQGVKQVVLCVGYMADVIERHFGDGAVLGLSIAYSREPVALGTAGALRHALPHLSGPVLVLNGDTYQPIPLDPLLAFHQTRKSDLTVVVTPVSAADDYGSVSVGPDGRLVAFNEKRPGAGFVNAGCYVLDAGLLAELVPDRPCSMELEAIPGWIAAGRHCYAWETAVRFHDIGTPDRYRAFQEEIQTLA
jgi:D-glycero-alpha-D-manno-heptose 1-phosphate guanylyltransferase